MKNKTLLSVITLITIIALSYFYNSDLPISNSTQPASEGNLSVDHVLIFPSERYPETAAHIKSAIKKGKSSICTIDRDGADENRRESLAVFVKIVVAIPLE